MRVFCSKLRAPHQSPPFDCANCTKATQHHAKPSKTRRPLRLRQFHKTAYSARFCMTFARFCVTFAQFFVTLTRFGVAFAQFASLLRGFASFLRCVSRFFGLYIPFRSSFSSITQLLAVSGMEAFYFIRLEGPPLININIERRHLLPFIQHIRTGFRYLHGAYKYNKAIYHNTPTPKVISPL